MKSYYYEWDFEENWKSNVELRKEKNKYKNTISQKKEIWNWNEKEENQIQEGMKRKE